MIFWAALCDLQLMISPISKTIHKRELVFKKAKSKGRNEGKQSTIF